MLAALVFFCHHGAEAFAGGGGGRHARDVCSIRAVDPATVIDYGELAATAAKRVRVEVSLSCFHVLCFRQSAVALLAPQLASSKFFL